MGGVMYAIAEDPPPRRKASGVGPLPSTATGWVGRAGSEQDHPGRPSRMRRRGWHRERWAGAGRHSSGTSRGEERREGGGTGQRRPAVQVLCPPLAHPPCPALSCLALPREPGDQKPAAGCLPAHPFIHSLLAHRPPGQPANPTGTAPLWRAVRTAAGYAREGRRAGSCARARARAPGERARVPVAWCDPDV